MAIYRRECERERENVTKGLIKKRRQTRRGLDQAKAKRECDAGEIEKGQTERIDDKRTKIEIQGGRDGRYSERERSKCHAARSECVA